MSLLMADWVFGYGSLIWNPDFDYQRQMLGRVHGLHRAFCIRSTRYRGTPADPGVVLGLDRGGSCIGMAFKLLPERRRHAIERLYEREMGSGVYVPSLVGIRCSDGQNIKALTFVANRQHTSYQRFSEPELLQRLHRCRGQRGCNREYLLNTLSALNGLGVRDRMLQRLAGRLQTA